MTIEIAITAGEPIHPGQAFEAEVVVTSDAPQAIDGIDASLEANAYVGDAANSGNLVSLSPPFAPQLRRLAEACEIDGVNRYPVRFEIPLGVPPSTRHGGLYVEYTIAAEVHVPWWFDPKETLSLAITLPPERRPAPRPATTSTASGGREELYVELALDDTSFSPGDTIAGAFSLGNVGGRRLDGSTISLIGVGSRGKTKARFGYTAHIEFRSLLNAKEGDSLRFALPIPKDVTPSFESDVASLEWVVIVAIDGSEQRGRVPVRIGTFGAPRAAKATTPTASIGETRWRRVWQDQGRAHGLELQPSGLSLAGTLPGGVTVEVEPSGTGLAATLRWESFGIGLSIAKRTMLRRGNVEVSDLAFDERFVVTGREPAQTALLLTAELRAALVTFVDAEADDEGAKLVSDGGAHNEAALGRFLAATAKVAAAFTAAEALVPPPSWLRSKSAAARWRAFASATGGRLHLGRLALLDAHVDGARVSLETEKHKPDKRAVTKVRLALDPPLPKPFDPARDEVDARTKAMLEALFEAGRAAVNPRKRSAPSATPPSARVRATRRTMTLTLGAPLRDPAPIREPVGQMAVLARHLRGEKSRGFYR